jgi:hypothetical protein
MTGVPPYKYFYLWPVTGGHRLWPAPAVTGLVYQIPSWLDLWAIKNLVTDLRSRGQSAKGCRILYSHGATFPGGCDSSPRWGDTFLGYTMYRGIIFYQSLIVVYRWFAGPENLHPGYGSQIGKYVVVIGWEGAGCPVGLKLGWVIFVYSVGCSKSRYMVTY